MNFKLEFTVIVPCLNEEEVLPVFIDSVVPKLESMTKSSWSILFVDDGSNDGTLELIKSYSHKDKRITCLSLSRNFGHQPAISAGLAVVDSKFIGIMDSDLQDPPEVLELLYNKVKYENYDVALGVRKKRDAPLWLKISYKLFYRIISKFSNHSWPLDAGDFSVFNSKVLSVLIKLPERDRMLRGLRSWIGFNQVSIPYDRPARSKGESKYNLSRLIGLAISAFVGFTNVPLRISAFIGLFSSFISLCLFVLIFINRLWPSFSLFGYYIGEVSGVTTLSVIILLFSSLILFSLGIIGEYLALVVKELKQRPSAIINEYIGIEPKEISKYIL